MFADGSACVSLKTPVQPPQQLFSTAGPALVSPVSSKKNCVKCPSGRNSPFSGRLNGVPFAALAAVFALNGALPSTAVSWIVTQLGVERLAVGVQRDLVGRLSTGVCDALVIGVCAAFSTCRTCSLPWARSPGVAGT